MRRTQGNNDRTRESDVNAHHLFEHGGASLHVRETRKLSVSQNYRKYA